MSHRRKALQAKLINLVLLAVLFFVSSQTVDWFVQPQVEWVDLVAAGDLESTSGKVFRRHLPRRNRQAGLAVTLCKPRGGMHNRIWSLRIEKSSESTPDESRELKWLECMSPSPTELTSFGAIQANDDRLTAIFNLRKPRFWYRQTSKGYQFLVYQHWDTDVRDHGFREGFFTWVEGDGWRQSDRHGSLGDLLPMDRL